VANVHGIYYELAVPLDGSTVNNALLIFNTVTKEWESAPDLYNPSAQIQVDNLLVTNYYGDPVLYASITGWVRFMFSMWGAVMNWTRRRRIFRRNSRLLI
jgi:hypothetical protein